MEINIGVRQAPRELNLDIDITAEELDKLVNAALENGSPLRLSDSSGRSVVVPADAIGYVEVASAHTRRVGFGLIPE
ncbi:DUF3107 domain-containing protein [Ancrocorticia populi]|uniref:DUF3107 domain-containing protein n=1 Tax=Ancrocorticia populi TaxID=2175228 RepID=UPI003F960EF7